MTVTSSSLHLASDGKIQQRTTVRQHPNAGIQPALLFLVLWRQVLEPGNVDQGGNEFHQQGLVLQHQVEIERPMDMGSLGMGGSDPEHAPQAP